MAKTREKPKAIIMAFLPTTGTAVILGKGLYYTGFASRPNVTYDDKSFKLVPLRYLLEKNI